MNNSLEPDDDIPETSDSIDSDYSYEVTIPGVIDQVEFCIGELKERENFKNLDQAQLADIAIKIVNTARLSNGMNAFYYEYPSLVEKLKNISQNTNDSRLRTPSPYQNRVDRDWRFL